MATERAHSKLSSRQRCNRSSRATEHGFFIIYLADGKAGFVALPNHRDVDAQVAYLAGWV
jgi:hypothetical protein